MIIFYLIIFYNIFLSANSLYCDNLNLIEEKARVEYSKGNYVDSMIFYKRIVKKDKYNFNALFKISKILFKLQNYEEAIKHLLTLDKVDSNLEVKELLVKSLIHHKKDKKENIKKAKKELDILYKKYRRNYNVNILYGYYYYNKKNFSKAEYFYNKAISINPNLSNAYVKLALLYKNLGNKDKYFKYTKAALKNNLYDSDAYYCMGSYYFSIKKIHLAERYLKSATHFDPYNQDAMLLYCIVLFNLKKLQLSYKIIDTLYKRYPTNICYIYNLSYILYTMGEYTKSLDITLKYLEQNSFNDLIYMLADYIISTIDEANNKNDKDTIVLYKKRIFVILKRYNQHLFNNNNFYKMVFFLRRMMTLNVDNLYVTKQTSSVLYTKGLINLSYIFHLNIKEYIDNNDPNRDDILSAINTVSSVFIDKLSNTLAFKYNINQYSQYAQYKGFNKFNTIHILNQQNIDNYGFSTEIETHDIYYALSPIVDLSEMSQIICISSIIDHAAKIILEIMGIPHVLHITSNKKYVNTKHNKYSKLSYQDLFNIEGVDLYYKTFSRIVYNKDRNSINIMLDSKLLNYYGSSMKDYTTYITGSSLIDSLILMSNRVTNSGPLISRVRKILDSNQVIINNGSYRGIKKDDIFYVIGRKKCLRHILTKNNMSNLITNKSLKNSIMSCNSNNILLKNNSLNETVQEAKVVEVDENITKVVLDKSSLFNKLSMDFYLVKAINE